MSKKQKKAGPDTTSQAYNEMAAQWTLMSTLLGGTDAMREAGRVYLPQHTAESDSRYNERLATSVLLNYTKQTLENLASKPFSKPLTLMDDVPDELREWLKDVDQQGNNLHVFCKNWFEMALSKCFAHVLVDSPRLDANGDKQRTLEDDRKQKVRPYATIIAPENLIFAYAETENGEERLTHVRIKEVDVELDGFAETYRQRIRVLTPGHVEVYELQEIKASKEEEWVKVEEWNTGLDYIPLITFYTHRSDFMKGRCPLLDLAHLNVAHWQSSSDQRTTLSVARFPILACSGAEADDQGEGSGGVVIGPFKMLYTREANGKFYYVEHTGAALASGQVDLDQLERHMSDYGAEFLKDEPGRLTATEKALDSSESKASLSAMAEAFEDAAARLLDMFARWGKINNGSGGSIQVVKNFAEVGLDQSALDALTKARERRDISRETFVSTLQRLGILPDDYDVEADAELLQKDLDTLLGGTQNDLNPGRVPGQPPKNEENPSDKKPTESKNKKPATQQVEDKKVGN